MEPKKYENKRIDRRSSLHFLIGLNIALALTLMAFEWKTEEGKITINPYDPIFVSELDEPIVLKEPPPLIKPPKEIPAEVNEVIEDPIEDPVEILPEIPVEPEATTVPTLVFIPIDDEKIEKPPFIVVEDMPEYPGGWTEFYKFISKQIKYPRRAQTMGIEGRVYVEFVIEMDGSITDLKVLKGIGAGCDEEAIRVMNMLPNFKPGKQRGKPVRVKQSLPINFQLN